MKRLAAVMGLLVAFALVAPPTSAITRPEQVARKKILKLINDLRATTGDGALSSDAFIQGQSQAHSKYMARTGNFGHAGVGAREDAIELNDADTDFRCENVAFVSGPNYTARSAARKLVKLWKNSPGHYDCMTDVFGVANEAGVGVKKKGQAWYATFIAANDTSP